MFTLKILYGSLGAVNWHSRGMPFPSHFQHGCRDPILWKGTQTLWRLSLLIKGKVVTVALLGNATF